MVQEIVFFAVEKIQVDHMFLTKLYVSAYTYSHTVICEHAYTWMLYHVCLSSLSVGFLVIFGTLCSVLLVLIQSMLAWRDLVIG